MSKYSHFEMCEKIFGQKYKWNEQKHDYEPYSRTDMWNKMIKQQDKISDLEAKLAECEKQIKDAREAGNVAVDSWCKNRRKYEAQIAEMQNKSFILYSMLYETLEKQGCDNVASQIDQMTGWTYDKETDWLKGNRNYDQLKQQLAKKDALLKKYVSTSCPIKQDKISFTIDELEKVKEWCENHKFSDEYDYVIAYEEDEEDASGCEDYFKDYIDNQIKQLKEKNNG